MGLGELVRARSAISVLSVGLRVVPGVNCHCGAERGRVVYSCSEGEGGGGKRTKLAKSPFREAMPMERRPVIGGDALDG